jgi:hypothetical protein
MARKLTHKTRAMQKLESLGWTVGDVERVLRGLNRRFDLFGVADLLAIKRGKPTLAVQVTSAGNGNVSAHVEKLLAEPRLWNCLECNWLVEIWGVRNKPTRDGSFAVVRRFELNNRGGVAAFDESAVL